MWKIVSTMEILALKVLIECKVSTKIKNVFENPIWIFHHLRVSGLRTKIWKQIWRKTPKNSPTKSGVDLDQFAVIMAGTWSEFI